MSFHFAGGQGFLWSRDGCLKKLTKPKERRRRGYGYVKASAELATHGGSLLARPS
jgi:hypothetical protein